jgi:hypothetical protein
MRRAPFAVRLGKMRTAKSAISVVIYDWCQDSTQWIINKFYTHTAKSSSYIGVCSTAGMGFAVSHNSFHKFPSR